MGLDSLDIGDQRRVSTGGLPRGIASPSSSSSAGRLAAAGLLRLGRIGCSLEELAVIADVDEVTGALIDASAPSSKCRLLTEERQRTPDRPIVEADLVLEDWESVQEDDDVPELALPHYVQGPGTGRRLMKARAQQCVVCMEEKEHTFVPPHYEDGSSHVTGHRFCTDCWVEFLYHNCQRYRRGYAVPNLACPVCRATIRVPDVWSVGFELPENWMQRAQELPEEQSGLVYRPSWWHALMPEAEPELQWAQAAPGVADVSVVAADAAPSSATSSECSPVRGDRRARTRKEKAKATVSTSCWSAFGCPTPAWQASGCLPRSLLEAFGGAPAQGPLLSESEESEEIRFGI